MDATFTGSVPAVSGGVAFTAVLLLACVSDIRTRRIPNRLVLVLAIGGLLVAPILLDGGIAGAVLGLLVGLALWLPLYALGAIGAGDVKLFAAAAAWLGPREALEAALLAAVIGGVLAVAMAARRGLLGHVLRLATLRIATRATRMEPQPPGARDGAQLPYGVALATGAMIAGWLPTFVW